MKTIRKKYSKEFKLEAIRMYENGERTELPQKKWTTS